jgi:hypothetical protein
MNDKVADFNLINKINPFVVGEMNLPGTWSDPYPYAQYYMNRKDSEHKPIECAVEPSCDTAKSPICASEITAGDHTIDMCRPTKPNLPMCRPLYPERNIDPGMWVDAKAAAAADADAAALTQKDVLMYVLVFILIIVILNRN